MIRKGQALQFNYMFEKGAFVLQPDETFSIDFDKVRFCDLLGLNSIIQSKMFIFPIVEGRGCCRELE